MWRTRAWCGVSQRCVARVVTTWIIGSAVRLVAATDEIFRIADVGASWQVLLDRGRGYEGAQEIIHKHITACHSELSGDWGQGCDRAQYLEAVLRRVSSVASGATSSSLAEDQTAAAVEVPVESRDALPLFSFFVQYALPRRPILLSDGSSTSMKSMGSKREESEEQGKHEDSDEIVGEAQDGRARGLPHSSSDSPSESLSARHGAETEDTGVVYASLLDRRMLELVMDCAPYEDEGAATAERPLRLCSADLLNDLLVPEYVVADYVQRWRKSTESLAEDDLGELEHFVLGWHSVHRIRSGSATPIEICPSGAHMLLSILYGEVEVQVFEEDELPYLRPTFGGSPCSPSMNASFGIHEYEERRKSISWPHEARYCASVWPDPDDERDIPAQTRPPPTNARNAAGGEMIFVPSGGAVSWRARVRGVGMDDESIALRYCYVDASNFNAVKAELSLYAAVEAGASALLKVFRAPLFDTTMARRPRAMTAAEFLLGSEGDHELGLSSSSVATSVGVDSTSGTLPWYDDELSSSSPSSSSSSSSSLSSSSSSEARAGGRGRRGRKSFKEWQEDSLWDLKVLGLTLPTLDPPRVSSCGRTNCTVEWVSSFLKQGQDQTAIGFNVSCGVVGANVSSSSSSSHHNSDEKDEEIVSNSYIRDGDYMEVFLDSPSLRSEHARSRELLSLGITEALKHTIVVDRGLEPDTSYRFSVGLVYGEIAGPLSEPSRPAHTARITSPCGAPTELEGVPGEHSVKLKFRPPQDDGGSPISWYHVLMRPRGEHVLNKWQVVGLAEAPAPKTGVSVYDQGRDTILLEVKHLLPGLTYQFRVCAQNGIGTSPWSGASAHVSVLKAASGNQGRTALSGFHEGHPHPQLPNVTDAVVSYAGERDAPPGEGFDPFEREVHGPTLVLDDRAGQVRVNGSNPRTIGVWASFFSPRAFRVTAEVVLAEPTDASRELDNARIVRNRVVIVDRGDTPIVHKVLNAQRSGALGVIMADDGRCGQTFDQLCVPGSDPPEGWAALDLPRPWLQVRVPVVLMLARDAGILRAEVWEAAREVEGMAWSSLYDGWYDSSS